MQACKKTSRRRPVAATLSLPTFAQVPEHGRLELDAAAALRWMSRSGLNARDVGVLMIAMMHLAQGESAEVAIETAISEDLAADEVRVRALRSFLGEALGEAA